MRLIPYRGPGAFGRARVRFTSPSRVSPLPAATSLLLSCLAIAATGCVSPPTGLGYVGGWDRNISDEGDRWGSYREGAVYELQRDVFLLDYEDRTNGLALVVGMETSHPMITLRGPTTVERYRQDPRLWRRIRGVLPEGSRVRCTQLRAKGNLRTPQRTRTYAKGRIIGGPDGGRVVDLEPVSIYKIDEETGGSELVGPNDLVLLEIGPRD